MRRTYFDRDHFLAIWSRLFPQSSTKKNSTKTAIYSLVYTSKKWYTMPNMPICQTTTKVAWCMEPWHTKHVTAARCGTRLLQVHERHRESSTSRASPGEVQDASSYAAETPGARSHAQCTSARACQARPQHQQGQTTLRRLLQPRRTRRSYDVSLLTSSMPSRP